MKERKLETREERIARLGESYHLLFQSMLKFGCYKKAHGELFKCLREQLQGEGIVFEECDAP